MARWALLLEYDGTRFVGWQYQITGPSIQSVLEEAVSRLAGAKTACTAAGRTDSGVHASGQVVHLDLAREMTPAKMVAALNYHLKPHPVSVVRAAQVGENFNARFSAIGRAYCYRIFNRPARPALLARQVWHVPRPLDDAAMHEGAQKLLGRHDFTSFRASSCQASSPLRTLDRLDVRRDGEMIEITAEARSFLHHQVRNMVGSLKLVGEGRWVSDDMARALAACDRGAAGPTAPPDGLCLTGVRYATDPFLEKEGLLV
jgi:tRNA pseudouridine38-40 synthase